MQRAEFPFILLKRCYGSLLRHNIREAFKGPFESILIAATFVLVGVYGYYQWVIERLDHLRDNLMRIETISLELEEPL